MKRDEIYDDIPKYRNGGIRLIYRSIFELPEGLKEGILLEVGFDKTAPNEKKDISSWAFDKGFTILGTKLTDNRAFGILCYKPKYTFVEKLQAIVRKYRLYKEGKHGKEFPENFLRHYYDIYCLLGIPEVQDFIGTSEYKAYKAERFQGDDINIKNCQGFNLNNSEERKKFETEYIKTKALYYRGQTPFDKILARFSKYLEIL